METERAELGVPFFLFYKFFLAGILSKCTKKRAKNIQNKKNCQKAQKIFKKGIYKTLLLW